MNRRRFITLAATAFATAGAGLTALVRPARANGYYSGPVSDHFDGETFFNPGGEAPRGFGDFLRWRFGEGGVAWPASFPSPLPQDKPPARVGAGRARIGFIGHASFLLQADGQNVLVDPVLSDRASPLAFAGPKRVNPPGIAFDDLPKIDLVLITHNHYDHLDLASLGRIWERDRPRFITPLGNDAVIRAAWPDIPVETGDWHASFSHGPLGIGLEPAQHWSARGMFDRRHALWGSFTIATRWGKIWFAGDTGFGDGRIFRALAARHPDIRLGLLPIGAYEPRWFMRAQHINPHDAVEIFRLLDLEEALGYHWGTFRLTNEAVDAPPRDLAGALARARIASDSFTALRPGFVWRGE